MSGDYSRTRFDPRKHFTGVLMQQGRVQLDSDWNEMVLQFDRRFRAERSDTLLRYLVPRRTPDAFRVRLDAGKLSLGTGRMYGLEVDSYVDERCDIYQSTDAACRYLKDLHRIFGNWELALAAYNCGPGNVNKAIRRAGGNVHGHRAVSRCRAGQHCPGCTDILRMAKAVTHHQ